MKHYRFKIKPEFLELIRNCEKKFEYRLYDEERSKICNGDRITIISNQNALDYVNVKVTSVKMYDNFEDAIVDSWNDDFKGQCNCFQDALKICYRIYSKSLMNSKGILKIGIKPMSLNYRNLRVLLDTNIIIHRESYDNVSFEVSNVYKWLDVLNCRKLIHPDTISELEKHGDIKIRRGMNIKLNAYEKIIPTTISDVFFNNVMKNFSTDDNSLIDNNILYQVYSGIADLLITQDKKILLKAEKLYIRNQVISTDEYLKNVEKLFPEKIEYNVLSIRKEKFGTINLNDPFFDTLKLDYPGFEDWFCKKNNDEAYVFKKDNHIHGFLYIKTEFDDEKDYLSVIPALQPLKRLKVGTFKIDNEVSGFRLGERFLKIIFDNALNIHADEIYVTLFENKRIEIDALRDIFKQWGFYKYGIKKTSNGDESVYVKKLNEYNPEKSVKYNFPNIKNDFKMFMLPINPEYHTELFPDSILKNEDMSLYMGNKGHLYSLEKIYVSGTHKMEPKPGDLIVIYRIGERYPKKYSSVCSGLAVLEEIIKPDTLEKYLNECKNKSVFNQDQLTCFYNNKKYRTVIKLITYKPYTNKILLNELIERNLYNYDEGPRPFDEIPRSLYDLFLKE